MSQLFKSIKGGLLVFVGILLILTVAIAQDQQMNSASKAESEMKSAFGTVPAMMEEYPEHMRAGAWEWFKTSMDPKSPVPSKYKELISLGVASQIPCSYCVYAHTTMAKMLGATDEEIKMAVATAAETRHWSTVLNGNEVPLDQFKKEWDQILVYLSKQEASK